MRSFALRPGGERGQTTSEYSIVIAVITIGCITAIATLARSDIAAIVRVGELLPG